MKRIELTPGQTVGPHGVKFLAEAGSHVEPSGDKKRMVLAECACGEKWAVRLGSLRSGRTSSCPSCAKEKHAEWGRKTATHGVHVEFGPEFYANWHAMVRRMNGEYAYLKHNKAWEDVSVFANYVRENGGLGWEPGKQLDRIHGSEGYLIGNVRYVWPWENMRNIKSNRIVEFRGITLTLTDWCEALDLYYNTVASRINQYGWTAYRSLTTPTNKPFALSGGHFDDDLKFLETAAQTDDRVNRLLERKKYLKRRYEEFAAQRRRDYQNCEGIFAGMTPIEEEEEEEGRAA